MNRRLTWRLFVTLAWLDAMGAAVLHAEDWPQWLGPERDGVYRESGIVDSIPQGGLDVLWRVPVANGYAGPAVADGRVFVTDYNIASGTATNNPGGRDELTGSERVHCLDAKTGEKLWDFAYERAYSISYPNGPRATPTVDGDLVFILGAEGDLHCLKTETGELVWKKQLRDEFGAETPIWGYAAHPLVFGDNLYTLAGGDGSAVVALDKRTGQLVWQALSTNNIGYCPPMVAEFAGQSRLIVWHSEAINMLDPVTGDLLWSHELKPQYEMSIAAPRLNGQRLFATGIGKTSVMLKLADDGSLVETVWAGKPKMSLFAGNATPFFDQDAVYGADCEVGNFVAFNPEDGSRYWETFQLTTGGDRRASHGTAFLVKHEDRFLIFTETGDLVIAKLSPAGFQELGRQHVLEATSDCFGRAVVWSHPAFAQKCLFARNDKEIVCVSLAAD